MICTFCKSPSSCNVCSCTVTDTTLAVSPSLAGNLVGVTANAALLAAFNKQMGDVDRGVSSHAVWNAEKNQTLMHYVHMPFSANSLYERFCEASHKCRATRASMCAHFSVENCFMGTPFLERKWVGKLLWSKITGCVSQPLPHVNRRRMCHAHEDCPLFKTSCWVVSNFYKQFLLLYSCGVRYAVTRIICARSRMSVMTQLQRNIFNYCLNLRSCGQTETLELTASNTAELNRMDRCGAHGTPDA